MLPKFFGDKLLQDMLLLFWPSEEKCLSHFALHLKVNSSLEVMVPLREKFNWESIQSFFGSF
jgi:hypothetical protein